MIDTYTIIRAFSPDQLVEEVNRFIVRNTEGLKTWKPIDGIVVYELRGEYVFLQAMTYVVA